jgi:hypothetical protein
LTGASKGNGEQGENAGDNCDRQGLIVQGLIVQGLIVEGGSFKSNRSRRIVEIAQDEMLHCNRTVDPV